MNTVRQIARMNAMEAAAATSASGSWHDQYKSSSWIYIGGLSSDLSEGDVICVFSQWGEIEDMNLVRDEETGKSRGFAFLKYEDFRSTVLAVDNFNGIELLGRTLRVDHKLGYEGQRKKKADRTKEDEGPQAHVPGHAYKDKELAGGPDGFTIDRGVRIFRRDGQVRARAISAKPPPPEAASSSIGTSAASANSETVTAPVGSRAVASNKEDARMDKMKRKEERRAIREARREKKVRKRARKEERRERRNRRKAKKEERRERRGEKRDRKGNGGKHHERERRSKRRRRRREGRDGQGMEQKGGEDETRPDEDVAAMPTGLGISSAPVLDWRGQAPSAFDAAHIDGVRCFRCGATGHTAGECAKKVGRRS
jgi:RNA-binding motif X-linked protein 2